ncbi:GROUP II INTRON SPLICING FACTOR CRS1-LIKE [Salix purpurea]|uniref:GROUP II INTRON SPLICING FACTOR CRS1-LIKE n=1 Tax=Salix purpurea TaxID=77065 RepID=A0A9Q0V3S4_SALPP|nr:GROUP II INTRON SPLICING FACTOR CRS1-LIKE [Salix purpurea]
MGTRGLDQAQRNELTQSRSVSPELLRERKRALPLKKSSFFSSQATIFISQANFTSTGINFDSIKTENFTKLDKPFMGEGKRRRREELLIERTRVRLQLRGRKRQKFANVEERIKTKLERARIKEAKLVERLKRYEVPKMQGPEVKPHELTGEERFFMKKMAQKKSNYVPIGRRGVFGEGRTMFSQIVMSPVDTLSKKKALEKSKYEQSLETVRHFIAISEKELDLYHRHNALYGDSNNRNPGSILDDPTRKDFEESGKPGKQNSDLSCNSFPPGVSEIKASATYDELSEAGDDSRDEDLSLSESDSEDEHLSDMADEESKDISSAAKTSSSAIVGSSSIL